ncbi:unnamed protein product [Nippostrongylus brasiliensis]|uniref:Oxidoreductase n=1 Tax=Nippostrongylus brasiliensis TaxID=27835 RepID=A0A0N4XUN8_NIPBR|nr:unnamed protein product [Nippostrongylus brasiliensis]
MILDCSVTAVQFCMTLLPSKWIELVVAIEVYLLAGYYALKELLFEATNQGINKRLENEIQRSTAMRCGHTKRLFITGADGTIGQEVVKKFLRYGFAVHALVGDRKKAMEVFSPLLTPQSSLTLYEVDLADRHEVVRFARGFVNRCGQLSAVVCCAGVMLAEPEFIDNVEKHMCVNVVSQALLLHLLDPLLTADSRVVFLSSSTSHVSYFNSSVLENDLLSYYVGPYEAYCLSKFVLSVYVEELAKRRSQRFATIHPGVVPGGLYRHTNIFVRTVTYFILPLLMRRPSFSALLVAHTTLRDDLASGSYYEDGIPRRLGGKLSEKKTQEGVDLRSGKLSKEGKGKESHDPRIARFTASVLLLATIGLMQMIGQRFALGGPMLIAQLIIVWFIAFTHEPDPPTPLVTFLPDGTAVGGCHEASDVKTPFMEQRDAANENSGPPSSIPPDLMAPSSTDSKKKGKKSASAKKTDSKKCPPGKPDDVIDL